MFFVLLDIMFPNFLEANINEPFLMANIFETDDAREKILFQGKILRLLTCRLTVLG